MQQALGVGVEPADVEEPLLAVGDEVADVDPAELVAHRRDDAERLVEREVDPRLVELHAHAVDVHGLGGADAHAELGDDLPVDLDPALADEVLADPARADAGRGEQLLQAHAVGVVDVDRGPVGPLRRGRRLAGLGRCPTRRRCALPAARGALARVGCRAGACLPARAAGPDFLAGVIRGLLRRSRRARRPRAGRGPGRAGRRGSAAPAARGSRRSSRRGWRSTPRRAPSPR